MKLIACPYAAQGSVNTVIGFCQTLKERGHDVTCLLDEGFAGKATKYGLKEIVLQDMNKKGEEKDPNATNPLKYLAESMIRIGFLSNRNSLEKQKLWVKRDGWDWMEWMISLCISDEPQVRRAIEEIKPDVIILDHFFAVPSILNGKIPWVNIWCSQPLAYYNSKELPPVNSGLPTLDRSAWSDFDELNATYIDLLREHQNKLLAHFGHAPVPREGVTLYSPYLNIYGYPKELDYQELVPLPPKTVPVDAFNRQNSRPYEWPVEFAKMLKPDDKLVYVSMGSMGSADVKLMKRITEALAGTPHKYIVSKGVRADEYELPENMYGEKYLPQTSILPKVDLVITHGGNNSTTETICAGKPMIVMPLFTDQFENAQRVAEVGFGVRLEPYGFEPEQLREAVDRLLNDEEVKRRVEKTATRIEKDNLKLKAIIAIEQLVK